MSELVGHIEQMALVQTIADPQNGQLRSVTDSLQLTPMVGWGAYTDIDFGTAEVDAVSTPYADRSGTFNETRYHRASSVSISMVLLDDWFPPEGRGVWPSDMNRSSYWIQRLGQWVRPSMHGQLYFRMRGRSSAYWMNIVGNGMTNAITMADRQLRRTQLNFVNPDGQVYRFNASYDVDPATTAALKDGRSRVTVRYGGSPVGGFTMPITFPMTFPSGTHRDPATVDYLGTAENGFVARIYAGTGAITYNARLDVTHEETGITESIGFKAPITGPACAARIPSRTSGDVAQFVEIDTNKRSVTMNADPNSRQNQYLSTPLNWPMLRPGRNRLVFTTNPQPNGSASPDPGSDGYIEVTWFEAYAT